MKKSAQYSTGINAETMAALNLQIAIPTEPVLSHVLAGDYSTLTTCVPSVACFPNLFDVYSEQQIVNALNRPMLYRGRRLSERQRKPFNLNLVGNETDLQTGNVPPQTPSEYVDSTIANMELMLRLNPTGQYIWASGAMSAWYTGWFRDSLTELRARRPDILAAFTRIGIHYYDGSLDANKVWQWLQERRENCVSLGLENYILDLTEIGAARADMKQSEARDFITEFWWMLRIENPAWLGLVAWFDVTNPQGMTYVTLQNNLGVLSKSGAAWAAG